MGAEQSPAESIFAAVLAKDSAEARALHLDEACGGDAELRGRVERLLAAHPDVGSFLETRGAFGPGGTLDPADRPLREGSGSLIGRYKLLEQIGEGGMGVVFLAEQSHPVRRQVALKVIKTGMDTRQVVARFEAERQALALMDHPNIAKVLDAGATDSGRPYFVMELVKGVPITRYCDEHRLTPRHRLELFVQVCQAVQHAHTKGIIHRDLKPSNVMVALYDGKPVPKVIDFGVAKATGGRLTDATVFTGFGAVVGTPEYMSPEQAELNQLDVDTRSDVYSLGVILYELLTGSTPVERGRFKAAALLEMLRVVREEEPPRPSTRLSTTDQLASIAASRGLEPRKLGVVVRGELDWIVMRALEKDRSRRYETANGFAADVRRYLADEPVQACPPSATYRFRKFARRKRAALAMGVLLGLSLLVMVGGITGGVGWAARDRAARDDQEAREAAARQAQATGQLERILEEVAQLEHAEKWPEALVAARRAQPLLAGHDVAVDVGERARATLAELEFVRQLDDIRAEGGSVWGDPAFHHFAVADPKYAKAFREFGIDLEVLPLGAAVDRIKACRRVLPAVIAAIDDWVVLRTLSKRGSEDRRLIDVINAVDPDPWRQSLRSALAVRDWAAVRRLAGSPELDRQPAATFYVLGAALYGTLERSLEIDVLRRAQWKYPADYWINHRLGVSLMWLTSPDQVAEGIGYIRAAIAVRPTSGHAMMNLGNGHRFARRLADAEVCYRRAVELDANSAKSHHSLGLVLSDQKKGDEAIASYRRATELDPQYAPAHASLGNALAEQGKPDEAVSSCRKAIELAPNDADAHLKLGNALYAQKKLDEATACYRKSVELDPNSPFVHYNIGIVRYDQGKVDEAITCLRRAIELDAKYAPAYGVLGSALAHQGKPEEAIAILNKAMELDPKLEAAYTNLGNVLVGQRRLDEAVACLEKAIEFQPKLATAHSNLANALFWQGKLDDAAARYRKAIALDPTLAVAHSSLGSTLFRQGKLDEAVASYEAAIEFDSKLTLAHSGLGNTLFLQGKMEDAAAAYQKVIELEPTGKAYNDLAWLLASGREARDPRLGLELAEKAVELAPTEGTVWNTLGVAHYRSGKWQACVAALTKSEGLLKGESFGFNAYFLAMAYWQLGDKGKARNWYDQAVAWTQKNQPEDEQLVRFQAEASELLSVKEERD